MALPSLGPSFARRIPIWAALAFFALAYAGIARFGLDGFPASGDEYSYLLQARIFAEGKLAVPAPEPARIYDVDHVVIDTLVRSKYPPGWPALLAFGCVVHAPWVVNPILAALTLGIFYAFARRFAGHGASLASVALVGVSPFFAVNAASFHSHPSCLFALAAFAYCVVRGWEAKRTSWAALGGAALGYAFLIRPVDAALFGLAFGAVTWRAPRYLVTAWGVATLVAALILPYQAAQYGSPWTSGYAAYDPILRELYGTGNSVSVSAHFLVQPVVWWDHVKWFVELGALLTPGLAVLAVIGAWRAPGDDARFPRRLLVAFLVAQLLFIPLTAGNYGDGYGPRYLTPMLLALSPFAAMGLGRLASQVEDNRLRGLAIGAVALCGAVRTGFFVEQSHEAIVRREALYRRVGDGCIEDAVIVVDARFPTRWTRNGARFDGSVLYVAERGLGRSEIARMFPTRKVYVAVQTPDESDWSVAPLAE